MIVQGLMAWVAVSVAAGLVMGQLGSRVKHLDK